jgi:hypothetical protein
MVAMVAPVSTSTSNSSRAVNASHSHSTRRRPRLPSNSRQSPVMSSTPRRRLQPGPTHDTDATRPQSGEDAAAADNSEKLKFGLTEDGQNLNPLGDARRVRARCLKRAQQPHFPHHSTRFLI